MSERFFGKFMGKLPEWACASCLGSGEVFMEPCWVCGGTGRCDDEEEDEHEDEEEDEN